MLLTHKADFNYTFSSTNKLVNGWKKICISPKWTPLPSECTQPRRTVVFPPKHFILEAVGELRNYTLLQMAAACILPRRLLHVCRLFSGVGKCSSWNKNVSAGSQLGVFQKGAWCFQLLWTQRAAKYSQVWVLWMLIFSEVWEPFWPCVECQAPGVWRLW